jgi:hypothetical protein
VIVREAGGWSGSMKGGDDGWHRIAVSNGQIADEMAHLVG